MDQQSGDTNDKYSHMQKKHRPRSFCANDGLIDIGAPKKIAAFGSSYNYQVYAKSVGAAECSGRVRTIF
jgi:hypothetical protein